MRFWISIIVILVVGFIHGAASAAKGDLAVRGDFHNFDELSQDRPFSDAGVVSGKCRDVAVNLDDPKRVKWMYRQEKKVNGVELKQIGAYYLDEEGRRSFCFDDLALVPFVEKNIEGEKISVTGLITSGRSYGLDYEEVILIDTMELITPLYPEEIPGD